MRLLPKDDTFWHFFTKQTASLTLASDLLLQGVKRGAPQLVSVAVRVKTIERESAQTLQELQVRLHKTFITPIDPEDISLLSEHLDHLLDDLEAVAYRISAYQLEPMPSLIVDLADRIHSSAELIEKAFGMLSINESTEDLCKEILSLEEQTDQAIREEVTRLFTEEKDPIQILKQKEIYDIFERLSDATQELGNALQNVSIKNS
ncbi:MAG: DUF47 family protein [Acidobacteriaceae bacterium]|nr:DUF47 family protein [Acidobacteriaceae bacterium]MBV9763429.1 DUF47 family protein [Acidobacteriaceae bacterium]